MGETVVDWTTRVDVIELCGRYAQALDDNDWDALADVFTADAEMEFAHVGVVSGVQAIGETCANALEHLDGSQHLVGSVVVSTESEIVKCRSYFQAQHINGDRQFLVAGSYEDTLTQTQSGWRIGRRVQSVTWTQGDASALEAGA